MNSGSVDPTYAVQSLYFSAYGRLKSRLIHLKPYLDEIANTFPPSLMG